MKILYYRESKKEILNIANKVSELLDNYNYDISLKIDTNENMIF